jgi:hypothetical protein
MTCGSCVDPSNTNLKDLRTEDSVFRLKKVDKFGWTKQLGSFQNPIKTLQRDPELTKGHKIHHKYFTWH